MATNILMPALSPTMTEGTLARWMKKEGEPVRAGDVIAEIETDKATMEVEAVDEGVLGKILVEDGTPGVRVNDPIGILVEEGEAVPDGPVEAASAHEDPPAGEAPAPAVAKPPAEEAPPAAPVPEVLAPHAAASQASAGNGHDGGTDRLAVSPLARRMAKQAGLDLTTVKGTGPGGRIVKADIEAAQSGPATPSGTVSPQPASVPAPAATLAPAAPPASAAPAITAPHTMLPHSGMRKVIARRLTEAKATIPHFYVSMDIELDALLALRAQLNAKSPKDGPGAFKLSVNDMLIKASAVALRRVPKVNVSWTDDGLAQYQDVDVSVAVSIAEGLITPIIRRADQKGLAAISNEMKDLIERARAGKLKPEEFQGGSFSISNMGMYGVSEFAAIINPPQSAILAVAAGQQRPWVKDGALGIATVMTCTLSVDHRAVDGALGAEWLAAFKAIVEEPLSLML